MTYIAFAFAVDFLTQPQVTLIEYPLAYLPFSALVIADFLFCLAAFAVLKRGEPISAATLPNVSQSLARTTGVYGSANVTHPRQARSMLGAVYFSIDTCPLGPPGGLFHFHTPERDKISGDDALEAVLDFGTPATVRNCAYKSPICL
jgi:hypothetical protein